MIKINIQHSKSLEPFFNFYVQNSPDVISPNWKKWISPDKEELEKRIGAYKNIWSKYEEKILSGISSALDLSFKKDVDVYIVAGVNRSMSNPVVISSHHSLDKFVIELAHELTHRIFEGTNFKFDKILLNKTANKIVNNHVLVYAVLRKMFENESEMLKFIAPEFNENYLEAYKLSENYEDVLKYFRDNK